MLLSMGEHKCVYYFLPQVKPLVALELKIQIVWHCTLLWPVLTNKTIMQQNRIQMLHHNGNLLEQKRRC